MSIIHVLPQALCNQIAAGEVLERAASAVKELVENSLDAGATSIEIELEDGGKKRLSVCDNGCGMSPEDAKLSILRHATSKIQTTQDLASISTMGFRGEALASMAAVSRMRITTQRRDDEMGTLIRVEGAEVLECRETAAPVGTEILLEDLFFNTPARLKFLKTTATETRRVCEVVEQFALACPEVRWKLTIDGRIKCEYPPHKSLSDRALAVFGRSLFENLFPLEPTTTGDVLVQGLFCSPEYSGSTAGRSYTYVNQRIVRDKTIQSAVSQAYREFLHGKQPCVVLFLSLPLDKVDVNVHPTKHEIRFQDQDEVFKAVYRALRQGLEKTPWIRSEQPAVKASVPAARYFEMLPDAAFRTPEDNLRRDYGLAPDFPKKQGEQEKQETDDDVETVTDAFSQVPEKSRILQDKARAMLSVFDNDSSSSRPAAEKPVECSSHFFENSPFSEPAAEKPVESSHNFFENSPFSLTPPDSGISRVEEPRVQSLPFVEKEEKSFGYFSSLTYIGQHALTYLICSDGDSLVIIDQHAAHERINYERLKKVADDGMSAEAQGLLFPVLIKLDPRLCDILLEYMSFFEKLGFQMDEMGNSTFALRSIPKCLDGYDYSALIRDALTDLGESGRATQFDEIRDDILATMACHSSIRAGYKMTPEEVRELFRLMDATGFRSNCPHGRPVHFVLPMSELEKRFLRTGYSGLG